MRILLVEDDPDIADALREALTAQRYTVDHTPDGLDALNFLEAYDYNVIVLDVMLPGLDGVTLCRQLRQRGDLTPVLMLTARDTSQDKVAGLDVGADDYVVKPFDLDELLARVRALLRRGVDRSTPLLTWERLCLNPTTMEVQYAGELLSLTPKEYSLTELFLRQPDRIFSRGVILENVWSLQDDIPSEDTVKAHIRGLRKKLKAAGAPAQLIDTVYGVGYRLNPRFSCAPGQEFESDSGAIGVG